MSTDAIERVRNPVSSPRPVPFSAPSLDLGRLRDSALLDLIDRCVTLARDRGLDADLRLMLGEALLEMQIEREARKAARGEPNMLSALPSVRAAEADEGGS